MKLLASSVFLFAVFASAHAAEEFVPPQGYDATRYEPVWTKNPFTLKTAPVAVQKESFAKDLAISSVFGFGEDTTVNVVNTKTREYFRLKNKEPLSTGMKVKSVNVRDTRAETFVEVELGTETAVLKYDEGFMKQVAAGSAQPKTPVAGQPPQGFPVPQQGTPPGAPAMQPVPASKIPSPPSPSAVQVRPPTFPPPQNLAALPAPQNTQPYVPSPPQRRQLTAPQTRPK